MARRADRAERGPGGRGIVVLFVLASLAGGAAIIGLRFYGFHALVAAGAGSAVIVLYALLALPFKPCALSTGVIGDNCYYLGFILTLTSLAWSLYRVGEGNAAGEDFVLDIVSGFGIALLTTAVGVVMRVALNPPKVDLVEEEMAAFHSLRHYYEMMHRDLASLTATNKQFALGMETSIKEFHKRFKGDLRDEATARKAAIMEIVGEAELRLVDRLAELEHDTAQRMDKTADIVSKHADDAVEKALASVAAAARARLSKVIRDFRSYLGSASGEGFDKMGGIAEVAAAATQEINRTIGKLEETVARLEESTQATASDLPERAGTMADRVERHLKAMTDAVTRMEKASEDLEGRLSRLSGRVRSMEDSVYTDRARPRRGVLGWLAWGRR